MTDDIAAEVARVIRSKETVKKVARALGTSNCMILSNGQWLDWGYQERCEKDVITVIDAVLPAIAALIREKVEEAVKEERDAWLTPPARKEASDE